ncbi:MAG: hypothetical protein DHS20C16_18390 [Phycisphaerae bacterium]|nr:MAG: hypothetical protein DHS20C16_18390 [Phycisphaerae bacterium]
MKRPANDSKTAICESIDFTIVMIDSRGKTLSVSKHSTSVTPCNDGRQIPTIVVWLNWVLSNVSR